MRTIRFGRTEAQVPVVSLGTWAYGGENRTAAGAGVGWSGHDDEAARAALKTAFEQGITHWDTADVYGDGRSEALIGRLWSEVPRDRVFLASKVGWDAGGHGRYYHPALVRERLERSLRLLQTDVIDLYYLHHCDFGPDDAWLDDALEVIHRARDAGKVRFVGLSDWDCDRVAALAPRVDPDAVQVLRNVTHDKYVCSGLSAWVQAHDAGAAFFSPIRHGLLLGKYTAPTTFGEGDFRDRDAAFSDAATLERLVANRRRVETELVQLRQPLLTALLGVLLADAPTGCVLLGQRNPRQVLAAAAADQPLTDDQVAWVRALYADLRIA